MEKFEGDPGININEQIKKSSTGWSWFFARHAQADDQIC
jgi:hypothetical protein